MNTAFLAPLLAFAVTGLSISLLLRSRLARFALDDPNHRSLHAAPVPRSGGLAILAGALAGWGLGVPSWLWLPLGLTLALAALSFADDLWGLPVRWRLPAHLAAAAALAAAGLTVHSPWLLLLFVPAIVWMTNLYNFMDGSDGLAGGMALSGFGAYGLAAWLAGDAAFAWAAWSLAAAAAGFLLFNFHPARIFMGDAGSIPLGFLAATFGLLGWQRGLWPWWFAPLVFSPFVADASITLAKRWLHGASILQAHREHYYQHLVRMGWGHRRTALHAYALMAAAGGSALWGTVQETAVQALLLLLWCAAYYATARWIDIEWIKFTQIAADRDA